MVKLTISKEKVNAKFESRFIKVYDLQYRENSHYFNATRRGMDDLVCLKSDEEFKTMRPDAVSCVVILEQEDPKLVLCHEFRYPTGQFLLGVPAGLMDASDATVLETAKREIKEECGLDVEYDKMHIINPLLFSTPGMSDESNALVCVKIDNVNSLSSDGSEGNEIFDGFSLLSMEDAKQILKQGVDQNGIYYSVYTWAALMYFVSNMWV